MKGRNLKLEDVLDVKSASATNRNSGYGMKSYFYNFAYPYIWNQYEKTQADSTANISTAYPLTTQDALTSNISASPYSTFWSCDTSWNSATYWKNAGYFRMVMILTKSNYYWLSTRYVYPSDKPICTFGLQCVDSYGVGTPSEGDWECLYYRDGPSPGSSSQSSAVRPLVSFPTTTYKLNPNGEAFDIVKKSN